METPSERGGILIVRVWVEQDRPDGFRARIIRSVDGRDGPASAACEAEDVLTAVRAWLRDVLGAGG
ncbi:hypothetical protein [Streptomyces yaizuensis]|uniref:Uncharacterized protein n=1 Tax=Streptomyces yaizuensis TaxID=2989713 RepID=A0ABQ5NSN7_9ACTN|nr:hypothetical protein [Streptomyces sp. YSPA8]GLF93389.1 hypothetical protein SYYSPA8_03850 [Streptomyces sp. YSPA8]